MIFKGATFTQALLINGSPNKNGCAYTALMKIAGMLKGNGVESEILQIGVKPIACKQCKRRRVFGEDAVNEAIEKLNGADALIVGAPVYLASPNGSLPAFLDRMFYAALDALNKYFTFAQMPIVSSAYWNMAHGKTPDDVRRDLEGLQTMRNLARNMAWMPHCIAAGREKARRRPRLNLSTEQTSFGAPRTET